MFKKCDLISPPITLYFKGDSIHSSTFAGILTIFSYFIIICFGVYYIVLYIYKANPNIYSYMKYIEDAGIFPLNSSSLYHFIKFADTTNGQYQNIDFESIRIFGLRFPIDYYISNNDILKYDHWLYGSCNSEDFKINIEYLNNSKFPEKSACIRKYFNSINKKYYETNDINFKWPTVEHGYSNDKNLYYGIIIEKCKNDSITNNCKSSLEINSYIEHLYVNFFFTDNYVRILNYKNPFVRYLYKLTNGFYSNSITINNLNFNPSTITTSNGVFIDF